MTAILPASPLSNEQAEPVRVLVIDDSIVVRSAVGRILEGVQDMDLAFRAKSLAEAFAYLEQMQVDIILLDHEMPGQKGLDALPGLLRAARGAHVIMLSSHCQKGSKTAVAALSLGASDILAKASNDSAAPDFAEQLLYRIRRLASARRCGRKEAGPIAYRPLPTGPKVRCIGIGASTGGIHSVAELLGAWRGKPDVPILITQHLPAPFSSHYAKQVARMCHLPVSLARDGEVLRRDHVYIAPGEASLYCRRDADDKVRVMLCEVRDVHTMARPSVNRMFTGMAASYGAEALGIVLTGIGRDGTMGGRAIVEAGGIVIAQDRQSSVVWGMPGSVAREGIASASLPPADMPRYLRDLCGVVA